MSSVKSHFSISEISRLSGVKAHTLRVWESRYGLIKPDRSGSNVRIYSEDHLQRIMAIIELKENGHKLSVIADLSEEEFKKEVGKCHNLDCESISETIQVLVLDLIGFDDLGFNRKMNQLVERNSIDKVIRKVILRIIDQIDVLILTGTIDETQKNFFKATLNRYIQRLIFKMTEHQDYYSTNLSVGFMMIGENCIDLEYNLGRYVVLSYHNNLYSIGEVESLKSGLVYLPLDNIDYLYIMIRDNDEYMRTKQQLVLFKEKYPQVKVIITMLGSSDATDVQHFVCNSFSELDILFKKLTNKNL